MHLLWLAEMGETAKHTVQGTEAPKVYTALSYTVGRSLVCMVSQNRVEGWHRQTQGG